jgi:hypothetical protein
MKKLLLVYIIGLSILLPACGSNTPSSPAVGAVESYIHAIVDNNESKLSALSCADWESQALIELDSFQAVKTSLEGLSCQLSGTDGANTLVKCQGKIIASYNGENQELDLSTRIYQVVQQGGDWLVCGVQ